MVDKIYFTSHDWNGAGDPKASLNFWDGTALTHVRD